MSEQPSRTGPERSLIGRPINFQLALQGGGAKIVALLATLEALQGVTAENLLKVTRIAGTSAGALAGCLFAAGFSMAQIKEMLSAGEGAKLLSLCRLGSHVRSGWKVLRGVPLFDADGFEGYLRDLFLKRKKEKLSDLEIETLVIAADLGTAEKVVYRGNVDIARAIVDSCGLPFCFRTWSKSGAVIVDGGICENLPSDELKNDKSHGDPVVAVTFERTPNGAPRGLRTFAGALLDTAISNSVTRSLFSMNRSSVLFIERDLAIETFDFQKALSEGLGNTYKLVKERADKFFREWEARGREGDEATRHDPWSEPNLVLQNMMEKMGRIHEIQNRDSKLKYDSCQMEIVLNSLAGRGEENFGKPDVVRLSMVFEPMAIPVHSLRFVILDTIETKYLGRTTWKVKDASNRVLETIAVPIRNPKAIEERGVVLYFDPPIDPGGGRYTLFCCDHSEAFLNKLLTDRHDELVFWPARAEGPIGQISYVFHVPKSRSLSIVPRGGLSGRPLNSAEEFELGKASPHGFRVVGWVAENAIAPQVTIDVYVHNA